MKKTVIITSNFVELSRKAERINIKTPHTERGLPITDIDGILLYGRASLSSEAISLCAKNKIPIIILTQYGTVKGLILPPDCSFGLRRRLKQAMLYFQKRLEVAKYIVKRKILEIEYCFDLDLEDYKLKVERVSEYAPLLGLEGVASNLMYEKFSDQISQTGFVFKGRSYNPPKDETNALLSFVYTLGYNLSIGLILVKGFDPYISFLHTKKGDHASFASDLMEIIRPHLTLFAADLLNSGKLSYGDFNKVDKGYFLTKVSLSKILEEFTNKKEDLTALMREFLMELEDF